MTKIFKLIGINTEEVYFESNDRASLLRWLDDEYGRSGTGSGKNISLPHMPEPMKIIRSNKSDN